MIFQGGSGYCLVRVDVVEFVIQGWENQDQWSRDFGMWVDVKRGAGLLN